MSKFSYILILNKIISIINRFDNKKYISKLKSRFLNIYLPLYIVKGKEKNGKSEISLLFLGDKDALTYILKIIFEDKPRKESMEKVLIWNIKRKLHHYSKSVDLVVIRTDRFFSRFLEKKGFFIIPEWIEMSVKISNSLKEYFDNLGSSAKKDIQLIKKFGYSYEISHNIEKLDLFYRKMFLPYVIKRHGKLAFVDLVKFNDLIRNFKRGFLLQVREKDKFIAGSLIIIIKKVAYPAYLGILDDSYYLPRGVGGSLYYFPLLWAEKNKINYLNFGNTRTFLNSGDFQYKRKWNMVINRSKVFFGVYGLMINNYSSNGIMNFLENNPFICDIDYKLKGTIFLQQPLTCQKVKELWKKYHTSGLSQLSIFSFHDYNIEVSEFVKSKYHNKIVLMNIKSLSRNTNQHR